MASIDLTAAVGRLAEIERGPASEGEAQAAQEIAGMLREQGLAVELEYERSVGGFWMPTGLAAGAGSLAGLLGRRRRLPAALLAGCAALLMADDVDGGRHLLRRLLPARRTTNVLARAGDPDAAETVVVVSHHDAAQTGLLFHPGLLRTIDRLFPRWYAKQRTSVQTGRLLVAGPALTALGCLLGNGRLRRFGAFWSTVTAALLADVARSPVVPGANDNLSAVAVVLGLAARLREQPPAGVRVLLLSTGSEETFMEGMRGFVRRHAAELDPAHTRFVVLECVGSPHLMLMEGEGMLRMRDHDAALKDEIQRTADRIGVQLWRGLRLGAGATDALPAMRAGYRAACIAACDELKAPANYHWPSDVPENLCWPTIERALELVEAFVRAIGDGGERAAGEQRRTLQPLEQR